MSLLSKPTFIPSSNGQKSFQIRVDILQVGEPLEGPLAPVILQVIVLIQGGDGVLSFIEPSKSVDQMSAQKWINIFNIEQAIAPSVTGPGSIVAKNGLLV